MYYVNVHRTYTYLHTCEKVNIVFTSFYISFILIQTKIKRFSYKKKKHEVINIAVKKELKRSISI